LFLPIPLSYNVRAYQISLDLVDFGRRPFGLGGLCHNRFGKPFRTALELPEDLGDWVAEQY
jgi:hypothetical protein